MSDISRHIERLSPERRALFEALLEEKKQSRSLSRTQTIPRRQASDPLLLSFAQQRLWFFDQLQPGSLAYNIPLAVHLAGSLDVGALERSLNAIVERHEILRTTFSTVDGQPLQVIAPRLHLRLVVVEQRGIDDVEIQRLATEENQRPFDLAHGPLLRATLLRLADQEHVLMLNMHHIVSDGWSMQLFVQEMVLLYRGFASGKPASLPPLPIQYADFALWQRQWLQGEVLETHLAYWKERLGSSLPVLALPTDFPRPPVQTYHGARHYLDLSTSLVDSIKTLAQREETTLFMVLLTAFKALLYRYTGQDELVVGTPVANRSRAELEQLIGFFVNMLVLCTDLSGNPGFLELLRQVRDVVLGAHAHQDLPFEHLVAELHPERNLSHSLLFQVSFGLQNAPTLAIEHSDLTLVPLEFDSRTSRFDIDFTLWKTAEGISGLFEYNTDLFEAATIVRMAEHFQNMLAGIIANPERRLADVPLLTAAERQQLLVGWNATAVDYPYVAALGLHQLFEAQAERSPEAIAVVFDRGQESGVRGQADKETRSASVLSPQSSVLSPQSLTYRELNERANRLAHHLRALGVGPERFVGVCLERSLDLVIALLSVLKAGGAYLPLDPTYPVARLTYMLEDSQPPVLLSHRHLIARLPTHSAQLLCLDSDWAMIARSDLHTPVARAIVDNLAYVIYTSGSTGQPKGVLVTHRNVVHSTWARLSYYQDPVTCFLLLSSFAFDSSVVGIFWTLCQGGALVLPQEGLQLEPGRLADLIEQQQISHLLCLPSLYALLAAQAEPQQLRSLRTAIVAGEACPPALVAQHQARLPRTALFNEYGPTEGTVWSSVYACVADALLESVPIGRPIPNIQIYLLDRRMRPVPIGVPGEIYIGGDGLARGYLNRPDLTAERFLPNPLGTMKGSEDDSSFIVHRSSFGERLCRTGDLAHYRADGAIAFLGRIDRQVKVRGFRIELGEIEAVLRQHPTVRESVVVVREARAGDKRLVAYVVMRTEGRGLSEAGSSVVSRQSSALNELRSFLKEQLPDHMVPAAIVPLETLPLTPSGKVDRRALPDSGEDRPELEAVYVAPRSEIERSIVGIWHEVLDVEKIGVHDNFFDLGGHSLLLVQVHSKLRKIVDRDLSVIDLFKYPTISSLTDYISQAQPDQCSSQQDADRAKARREAIAHSGADIAIIAMALRFPGAHSPEAFWQNLHDGVESISFFSDEEVLAAGVDPRLLNDPNYVKAEATIDDIELFDAAFFGYTPREAERLDPQQRFFLECAWEAMERAGYDTETYKGRVGVYGGVNISSYMLHNMSSYYDIIEVMGNYHLRTLLLSGNINDFLCQRVSYHLKLTGPSVNVQTACSSSLVAVHMAAQSLLHHECDMALAGGIQIRVPQKMGYLYLNGGVPSPDGHCRAFDAKAQGTIHANGVGIVVLKRLADAIADGDQIYAVIKGSAINNDGALKVGFTAPSVEGQAKVVMEALAMAEVDPETIGYIEAHGTGTELGDPLEIAALTQAFRASTQKKGFCGIGSVKTNFGHLDQASGVASLIKTSLALTHKMLPPSLHFESPNPKIDFENSPFYVNATLSEWKTNGTPRRAGVCSYAIGGTNAHIVLEEAPIMEPSGPGRPWHVLVLSAKTSTALETATANLAGYLKQHPDLNLADVAYTLQLGRSAFKHRRVVVCAAVEDAIQAVETLDPQRVDTGIQEARNRPVVFMFAGEGAQYVNMALELYQGEPAFRAQIDRCAELLMPHLGRDLRAVLYPADSRIEDGGWRMEDGRSIFHPPSSILDLDQTQYIQPALFVVEYALARLWMAWGVQPQALIGHGIGEYVAACLAGVFSLEDALALVAARGRLIQELPPGAMLVVPLPEQEVQSLLSPALSLAAVDSTALCVISGPVDAVTALENQLAEQGVDCHRLSVAHAFHSAMIDPIMGRFAEQVRGVRLSAPTIPYISNVTGTWITAQDATNPGYWVTHLRQTARFADGLRVLLKEPECVLLELGPGYALSTFARQHPDKDSGQIVLSSLRHPNDRGSDIQFLLNTVGKCWLAGTKIDWAGLYVGQRRRRIVLPTYPFERQRYWIVPRRQQADGAGSSQPIATERKPDIADWFYIPSWKQVPPPASTMLCTPHDRTWCWLVLSDECGLGCQVVRRLEQLGQDIISVRTGDQFGRVDEHSYTMNPWVPGDYDRLLEELGNLDKTPTKIVHLWNITPDMRHESGAESLEAIEDLGLYSLLLLAGSLDKQNGSLARRIAVVSNNTQGIHGAERLCPEKAAILGPCRAISQQYPHLTCQSIDLVVPEVGTWQAEKLAERLIDELTAPSAEAVVAYRGHQRWMQTFEPVRLDRDAQVSGRLREKGVYLITGGLGTVGLALAEDLAQSVRASLVLTDCSAFPDRAVWEQWLTSHDDRDVVSMKIRKLQELERAGTQILVINVDVGGQNDIQGAIDQVYGRFGELHGVIHAAGIDAGWSLPAVDETSLAEAEQHFRPDMYGLYALESALQGRKLDFCLLLSSLSAGLGRAGPAAHASTHTFMSAFAHEHTRTNPVPWMCVHLDDEHLDEEQGQTSADRASLTPWALTVKEVIEIVRHALSSDVTTALIVSPGALQVRMSQITTPRAVGDAEPENHAEMGSLYTRPAIESAYVAPRNGLEQMIANAWQELLGIGQVGIYDNFFELGGHSLLATQLVTRLRETFQLDIPLRDVLEMATVAEVAETVARIQVEQSDAQELARLLEELEQMSDEQAKSEVLDAEPNGATHEDFADAC